MTQIPSASSSTTSYDVVETLVSNHRQFLAFLEKRVGSREVAEDILQEAFVRGLDSKSLGSADSATAWFYRALRNATVDHYRRRDAETRALEQVAAGSGDESRTGRRDDGDGLFVRRFASAHAQAGVRECDSARRAR